MPEPRKIMFIGLLPLTLVILLLNILFSRSEEINKKNITEGGYIGKMKDGYNIFSVPLPDDLTFAGEKVPLENFDIFERLDREIHVNTYWQSQTVLFFKRANRWFPVIEPILEEEGVPEDFKYLALIESGLMNVISPAGATGFWQILKSTGREYGLEVNNSVDERYHVEKSTRAACKYFNKAYDRFGSWTLAAASYNMGQAGLSRRLDQQRVNDYYSLLLNDETSRYVFRILAIKQIFENPQYHGFHFRDTDLYQPFDYFSVTTTETLTDLVSFAHEHQITYKELKILNPWLRDDILPNSSGKEYSIKITKESLFNSEDYLQSKIYNGTED